MSASGGRATAAKRERPLETRTFLIADVRNYTRFTNEHGPQAAAKLTEKFARLGRTAVNDHRGRVMMRRGDEIVAVFETPRPALQAALRLQQLCAQEMGRDPSIPLLVGIGVARGQVAKVGKDYRGEALNLASRLCSTAHAGETLISAAVRSGIRGTLDISFVERGTVLLRGFAKPVAVLRALPLGESSPESSAPLEERATPTPWLPEPLTEIIGREDDIHTALNLLRRSTVRLVTITGTGGVGKTRLGLHLASALRESFADGVYYVELAALREADLVLPAVAQRLGVTARASESVADALAAFMREKKILIVLDNVEQVVECAAAIATLLETCPKLKVLATSRLPLRLRGERELPLSPLLLPEADADLSLDTLLTYPAIRLFVERAESARPGFQVRHEDMPALISICRRLDGLPLMLELAAARVRMLPLKALAARLSDVIRQGGGRGLPDRHKSVRALVDWSYSLLSEEERAVFRRLAIFSGGCTLEAAEAVCQESDAEEADPFAAIGALVDHSLLTQREHDGEPRFLMLETIRECGLDWLAQAGEAALAGQAHAGYFLGLAERAAPELTGAQQREWLQALDADYENLRAALRTQVERDAESAVRLAVALHRYWESRGLAQEARQWLDQALDVAHEHPGQVPDLLLARVLYVSAFHAFYRQDYELAERQVAVSREMFETGQDDSGLADALNLTGLIAMQRGDKDVARTSLIECAALRRARHEERALAMTLVNLAVAVENPDEARPLAQEALQVARHCKDASVVALALNNLGLADYQQSHLQSALEYFEEALLLYRQLGARRGVAMVLNNLGDACRMLGQYERAYDLLTQCLKLREDMQDRRGTALAYLNLGYLSWAMNHQSEAITLFDNCRRIAEEKGFGHILALATIWQLRANPLASAEPNVNSVIAKAEEQLSSNPVARAQCNLIRGIVAHQNCEFSQAATCFISAATQSYHCDELFYTSDCLEGLVLSLVSLANHRLAAEVLGALSKLRDALAVPIPLVYLERHERCAEACEHTLGIAVYERLFHVGAEQPVSDLIDSLVTKYAIGSRK